MAPDRRREAIVAATVAVARRKGLATTTVRDVAAEMGTSSGLIHHYFASMDDVLAAAFEVVASQDLELSARLMSAAAIAGRSAAHLLRDVHPGRQGLGVPALARCMGRGRPSACRPGHVAAAESRVAGAAGANDPGGRRGWCVRVRRAGCRRVADPVAARRPGAAGRRPRHHDQPRGRGGLVDGCRGTGAWVDGGCAAVARPTLAPPGA